jgi:hypothetical protein
MSEQKNVSRKTEAPNKKKRETFEILAIGLDCSGGVDQHIEVVYNLRYKGVICRNRRETVHLFGTWPEHPLADYGCFAMDDEDFTSTVDTGPLTIKFTEQQERQIRSHLNVWVFRLYARLLRVVQPESEYTKAVVNEAKITARAFGYEWEDDCHKL